MKIYLIRHGETDWNKMRKLQGQVDIPLNEFGRHLAIETEPALRNVPFDIAFTSPLKRAKETAMLVLGNRNIPIIEDERIMEMGFGDYEGLCCKKDGWNIPDPDFQFFFDAPQKYHPPKNGESFAHLSDRLNVFLQELYANEELSKKTILVSTHGAALCGILRLMKGNPMEQYWGKGVHKNCAVTIVEVENGIPVILSEGVTYYHDEVKDW